MHGLGGCDHLKRGLQRRWKLDFLQRLVSYSLHVWALGSKIKATLSRDVELASLELLLPGVVQPAERGCLARFRSPPWSGVELLDSLWSMADLSR